MLQARDIVIEHGEFLISNESAPHRSAAATTKLPLFGELNASMMRLDIFAGPDEPEDRLVASCAVGHIDQLRTIATQPT
jgi:hypothetical protein